jgi:two-component system, cell cycle sensor histidine kinase and response regulator CckA
MVDVNRMWLAMLGYHREELIGASSRGLGLWKDWSVRERLTARLRAEGSVREEPVQLVTRDGAIRDTVWSGEMIAAGDGRYMLSAFHDVTERRQLEERLLHSQKMEAVARLAGGIAHDFNNMIGVIMGFASILEEKLGPESPMRSDVQEILAAAQRSANLTRQLLAFARKQVATPVPLDLNQSLASMQKVLERLIGEDIALSMRFQEGLWPVNIDPSQFDQIIANLATNARDAIEDVGSIIIRTSNVVVDEARALAHEEAVPGEYVELSFSDTGRGMDAATQARLFEPFFTTKPKDKGTGLGLATIFGIVRQNNGFLSVYSEVGTGTTFRLFLPRYHGAAEPRPVERAPEAARGGTETVLVVEDEEQLLALAKRALSQAGYTVVAFTSPRRALSYYEGSAGSIDLLLSDIVMPEMNGKELSERLRAVRPGLAILYMSGYPADVIAQRGLLEEGTRFIQKPFKPKDLLVMVRKVLDG